MGVKQGTRKKKSTQLKKSKEKGKCELEKFSSIEDSKGKERKQVCKRWGCMNKGNALMR